MLRFSLDADVVGGFIMTIAQTLRSRTGFISLKDFAAAIGSHPQTLYKRLRADPTSIPHTRLGVKLLFDPEQVADWLESRRVG